MSNPRPQAVCKHGNAVSLKPSIDYVRCAKCDAEADAEKEAMTTPEALPLTAQELAEFYDWASVVAVADKEPIAPIWFRKALATIAAEKARADEAERLLLVVTETLEKSNVTLQNADDALKFLQSSNATLSAKLAVCVEALKPFAVAAVTNHHERTLNVGMLQAAEKALRDLVVAK